MRLIRRHFFDGWVALGLAGSVALSAADSQLLQGQPIHWWLTVHLGSRGLCDVVFWGGLAALAVAWLGLGRQLGRPDGGIDVPRLLSAGALWAVPLMVAPALASGDMYSYLAQGDMLRLGLDPYHHGPAALIGAHQLAVLHPVSPFWRHTAAPYGPLFIGIAAAVSAIAGSHLVLAVTLLRGVELVGLALLAVYVPRLARGVGADPCRAVWLAVISPLVLVELVGGGHNDALMAGLLVAGVTYAVERRPLLGIALCVLAAMVKLPAAAGAVLIVACWLRELRPDDAARTVNRAAVRAVGSAVAVAAAVVTVVGLVTTVGFSWVNGGLLSGPTKLHVAITPATAVGYCLHALFGVSGSAHPLEQTCVHAALVIVALISVIALGRVRYERLALYLGIVLLASVLGGPVSWPWYLTWTVALIAVDRGGQMWVGLPFVLAAETFLIRPNGVVDLPITSAPFTLAVYAGAAVALIMILARRQNGRPPITRSNGWGSVAKALR